MDRAAGEGGVGDSSPLSPSFSGERESDGAICRFFAPMAPDSLRWAQRLRREGMGVAQAEIATQLYAVVEAGEAALDRLTAALSAAEFCLRADRCPRPAARSTRPIAQPLVEAAQEKGHRLPHRRRRPARAHAARRRRASGRHQGPAAAYEEARSILGRDGIVGVDPGISRHDAMTLAEAGAEYIAFGAPAHLKDRDRARERRDELIAWWAEIFQAPCVALDVETPEEAGALARRAPTSWVSGCRPEPRRRQRAISWPRSPRRCARPRQPAEGQTRARQSHAHRGSPR